MDVNNTWKETHVYSTPHSTCLSVTVSADCISGVKSVCQYATYRPVPSRPVLILRNASLRTTEDGRKPRENTDARSPCGSLARGAWFPRPARFAGAAFLLRPSWIAEAHRRFKESPNDLTLQTPTPHYLPNRLPDAPPKMPKRLTAPTTEEQQPQPQHQQQPPPR